MLTKKEITILRDSLPPRAAYAISQETGISRPTIYKYFNGGSVRDYNETDIVIVALQLIKKNQTDFNFLKKKFDEIF